MSISAKNGSDLDADLERSSISGIQIRSSLPKINTNRKKDLDPTADSALLKKMKNLK